MGLFNKFFGGKEISKRLLDTSSLKKIGEMMDEKQYWNIIQKSLSESKSQDEQEVWLIQELQKLSLEEIIGFRLRTDLLLYNTYTSETWCAGYIMNGGCSDDLFEYFRCWIISRGEKTYQDAKQNPDSLVDEAINGVDLYDFESFWYVALTAFERNTGKDLYDFIDYDTFTTREGKYPDFEFNWKEDNPESMKKICPRLFERFC
jgi:hypothetical protein